MACGDSDGVTSTAPSAPRRDVSDGSNGGPNPRFYFLSPIGSSPSATGDFSAVWRPSITICLLVNGACSGTPATIAGPAAIAVNTTDQAYQYNWNTDGPAFDAVAVNTYRLSVTLPTSTPTVIGYADILINNPGQSEGSGPGGVIAFNDGRTVPIKFRIEKGVMGAGDEFLVPNSGKVIRVPFAGVYFTPGWLGAGPVPMDPQVTVLLQRIPAGTETCKNSADPLAALLLGMETYAGCYRLTTIPSVAQITPDGKLGADVIMAMCTEVPSTGDRYPAQAMFKYDAPSKLLELESVSPWAPASVPGGNDDLFLKTSDCDGFTTSGQTSLLWSGARALARGLGKVFGPNTAWALDAGLGSRIPAGEEGFSDFFWGVPTRIEKVVTSDAQTAQVGTALAIDPTAFVHGRHDFEDGNALGNIQVSFEVIDTPLPGGSLGLTSLTQKTAQVMSIQQGQSGHGRASIPWVMPADPGVYTLKASISESPGDQADKQTVVYFTATATAVIPKNGKEVRIVGPESPGTSPNVYMAPNVGRPFNAKAYLEGRSTNTVCIWSTAVSNSYVTIVPSGANDPGSVSISISPLTAGGNRGKVNITCGSGSTGVSRTIFFFAQ